MSHDKMTKSTTPPQTTNDPDKLPQRGLASQLFNAAHDCYTPLREQHAYAWHTLRHAPDEAIALYPCFVDGKATTAIGLIARPCAPRVLVGFDVDGARSIFSFAMVRSPSVPRLPPPSAPDRRCGVPARRHISDMPT